MTSPKTADVLGIATLALARTTPGPGPGHGPGHEVGRANEGPMVRVAPQLLKEAAPHYPAEAKRDGIEGVVVLSITIDATGRVDSALVLRGLGHGLDESALAAARQTFWLPGTLDGRPVRITRRFSVRFTLQS